MTHLEFGDILMLGDKTFWSSIRHSGQRRERLGAKTIWLYAFVGFVAVLCIACNLMGPATAVLVIPSIGWSPIQGNDEGQFGKMANAGPPRNANISYGCNTTPLEDGKYSCISDYKHTLDEWSTSAFAGYDQFLLGGVLIPGISQEDLVSFYFNISADGSAFWVSESADNAKFIR